MAAAAFKDQQIIAQGAAGVRCLGRDDKIAIDNRFLIGSCTKRMTGLLICRLINETHFGFESTLADLLPGFPMRDEFRSVTITQLLSFTAGILAYTQIGPGITRNLFELKGSPLEQREQLLRHVLQEEPIAKPGTERNYSNTSYALLAFVAAQVTKTPIESLYQKHIFGPLGMVKAGVGRPRTKEHPDEPFGHIKRPNGYEPEPEDRIPPVEGVLVGAGGVYCTAGELARFANYELTAAKDDDELLRPDTARRWQKLSRNARTEGQPIFGGTQWLTSAFAIWPSTNLTAAAVVNAGGAMDACRDVLKRVAAT